MIVPAMSTRDIVREITLDSPLVHRKADYLSESLRRTAVKSKDKCYFHIFDYKSKRQNSWLIIVNYYKGLPTINTIVYYLNEQGINAIAIGEHGKFIRFSPHFLIRYNERFLKKENSSRLDLLKQFITANKVGVSEVDDTNQGIFCRFTEGIGLGNIETIDYLKSIYHFRTFISNQMIFEDQLHYVKSAGEYYDKYEHEFQKYLGIKSL